jgi:DNA-binding NarL/FixJ family response regulator
MNQRIKVLLANEPQTLRTRIEALLQNHSDVEAIGTVLDPIELLLAVEENQADVVVVTLPDSGEMPGICSHLLHEYPQLLILALSSDRHRACVYRQVMTVADLPDTSDEALLRAIRTAKADHTS